MTKRLCKGCHLSSAPADTHRAHGEAMKRAPLIWRTRRLTVMAELSRQVSRLRAGRASKAPAFRYKGTAGGAVGQPLAMGRSLASWAD